MSVFDRMNRQKTLRTMTGEEIVTSKIQKGKWLHCLNPNLTVLVHFSRTVGKMFDQFLPPGADTWNEIGCLVEEHLPRLQHIIDKGSEIALSEALMTKPFKGALHLMMMDGQVWVSENEWLPYRSQERK